MTPFYTRIPRRYFPWAWFRPLLTFRQWRSPEACKVIFTLMKLVQSQETHYVRTVTSILRIGNQNNKFETQTLTLRNCAYLLLVYVDGYTYLRVKNPSENPESLLLRTNSSKPLQFEVIRNASAFNLCVLFSIVMPAPSCYRSCAVYIFYLLARSVWEL
jgi:hypothetical protein